MDVLGAGNQSGSSLSERADQLEAEMSDALDRALPVRSVIFTSGDDDPRRPADDGVEAALREGRPLLMADDPRLPALPPVPSLRDFFQLRFAPAAHVLQSAALALARGCSDTVVLACLLHDIAILGFIRGDHGYWGAQLVEPYVDEEISWAIRAHQVARFYPDPDYGYVSGGVRRVLRGGLPRRAVRRARVCEHPPPPLVRDGAADHGERRLRV